MLWYILPYHIIAMWHHHPYPVGSLRSALRCTKLLGGGGRLIRGAPPRPCLSPAHGANPRVYPTPCLSGTYTYIYIYIYICIYIYIHDIHIYIYMHIHREREREIVCHTSYIVYPTMPWVAVAGASGSPPPQRLRSEPVLM